MNAQIMAIQLKLVNFNRNFSRKNLYQIVILTNVIWNTDLQTCAVLPLADIPSLLQHRPSSVLPKFALKLVDTTLISGHCNH